MTETIVFIIGANRGIGYETARQLAQGGMTVLLGARDPEKAESAAAALRAEGLAVTAVPVDGTDADSLTAAASVIGARCGRLDVLVYNAAQYAPWGETALTADLDAVHGLMEVNLYGPWRAAQIFAPLLRQSPHGRLVLVSSGAGSHTDPQYGLPLGGAASYGISKAALNALTTKLALDFADSSVLVNAVCPGLTATAPGMEDWGARPIPAGAASVAWAARLPADGPRGGFFRDGQPVGW